MDVILVLFLSVIGDVETIVCVYRHRSACTGRNHASGGPSIGADRDISCKICRLVRGIGKLDARYTASAAIDRKCILGCETRSPVGPGEYRAGGAGSGDGQALAEHSCRSEEHTSELQSLMRISYAVFCLKKKNKLKQHKQQYR